MKKMVLVLVAVSMAGCQTVPKSIETASGRPEKTFHNVAPERVQAKLSEYCLKRRSVIEVSTSSQVVCAKDPDPGDSVLLTFAMGNAYSTSPKIKARFTIVPVGRDTMVQGYQWAELQMAMGQVRQAELNSGAQFNGMQKILDDAAAELEQSPPGRAAQ